jgi:anoctamin-10
MLEEYEGAFFYYKDLAVQFGYVVLFSVAFPLAPLLFFVSTYFEIRVDAWSLLQRSRRNTPQNAEDIGTWQSAFEVLAAVSVLSNMGIVFLVSASKVNSTWLWRIILFLIFEHALFGFQILLALLLDDVPQSTASQLARQEFLASKLIDNVEDTNTQSDDKDLKKDDDDFVDDIFDDDPDPAL